MKAQMQQTQGPAPQAGFTLIEVLLGIGITAMVMTLVITTTEVMSNARNAVDYLSESSQEGPRILKLIERDLLSMDLEHAPLCLTLI